MNSVILVLLCQCLLSPNIRPSIIPSLFPSFSISFSTFYIPYFTLFLGRRVIFELLKQLPPYHSQQHPHPSTASHFTSRRIPSEHHPRSKTTTTHSQLSIWLTPHILCFFCRPTFFISVYPVVTAINALDNTDITDITPTTSSAHPQMSANTSGPEPQNPPKRIPRPFNCFMIYRRERAAQYAGLTARELTIKIGKAWQNETPEIRAHYGRLADQAKAVHFLRYSTRKFTSARRGTGKRGLDSGSTLH